MQGLLEALDGPGRAFLDSASQYRLTAPRRPRNTSAAICSTPSCWPGRKTPGLFVSTTTFALCAPTSKGSAGLMLTHLESDDRIPRSQNGENEEKNLCLLCPPCNRRKSNKMDLAELRRQNRAHGNIMDEKNMTLKA